jgi:hypothetical protein
MVKAFRKQPDWFKALQVKDQAADIPLGTLVNLTNKNLILESPTSCQTGQRYHCRLQLPSDILGHTQIFFEVTCGESHLNPEGGYLNFFSSLVADPFDADALEMLIIKFAIKALDT